MFFSIKNIQEKYNDAELPPLISVPLIIIASGTAFVGLSALLKLLFGNTNFSLDEQWSLMFCTFLGGFMFRFYAGQSSQFAHMAQEPNKSLLRKLLGFSVFGIALAMASDFSMSQTNLLTALPKALFALGTYILIVGLPWHGAAELKTLKSLERRIPYNRYAVEGRTDKSAEWIVIFACSDGDGHMHAMLREQQEASSGKWRELRVIYEVGSIEVINKRIS